MTDPLAPFRWLEAYPGNDDAVLGEIFSVSFFRRVDRAEVLRRFGLASGAGREMTFTELCHHVVHDDDGDHVGVVRIGEWSVAIEPNGFQATLHDVTPGLSVASEVVAVTRHDYAAEHGFAYAIDGVTVTGFSPRWPERRYGSEPDRLNGLMSEVGLGSERPENPIARAFALAAEITGVAFTPTVLRNPLLAGPIKGA